MHSAPAFLRLAQIETKRKNWPEARRLLLAACRFPLAGDLRAIADYLLASGGCDGDLSRRLPGDDFLLTSSRRAQLGAMIYAGLKTANRSDDARKMAIAHPELLASSTTLAAALRQDAAPAQFPAAAAAMENAAAQADPPVLRLYRELAALYLRWSEQDTQGNEQNPADRLEHLQRANRLEPRNYEVARRLAMLCWENRQPAQAISVLQPFLAAEAVPAECDEARRLIAQH